MCNCDGILLQSRAQLELKHIRPDRIKIVLGGKEPKLFDVVFVVDGDSTREVTLRCSACARKWLIKLGDTVSLSEVR